jgi:N-acylneuraminate cytidylyltransferase
LVEHPDADAVRTVCVPFQNPFKMWRIGTDGFMQPLGTELGISHEPYNQPRQALPEVYWQTGYIDAAWTDTILHKNSMTGDYILPLVIDPSEWVDIDSPDDWARAERLISSGEITLEDLGFSITEL